MSDINRNSLEYTLSRIETKLDDALKVQDEQTKNIAAIWRALARIDLRVAVLAASISSGFLVIKYLFFK
jgi:hypothetical protein